MNTLKFKLLLMWRWLPALWHYAGSVDASRQFDVLSPIWTNKKHLLYYSPARNAWTLQEYCGGFVADGKQVIESDGVDPEDHKLKVRLMKAMPIRHASFPEVANVDDLLDAVVGSVDHKHDTKIEAQINEVLGAIKEKHDLKPDGSFVAGFNSPGALLKEEIMANGSTSFELAEKPATESRMSKVFAEVMKEQITASQHRSEVVRGALLGVTVKKRRLKKKLTKKRLIRKKKK